MLKKLMLLKKKIMSHTQEDKKCYQYQNKKLLIQEKDVIIIDIIKTKK